MKILSKYVSQQSDVVFHNYFWHHLCIVLAAMCTDGFACSIFFNKICKKEINYYVRFEDLTVLHPRRP